MMRYGEGRLDCVGTAPTGIPKSLHREVRLHCVTVDTSVMDFVVKAIEEKLAGSSNPRGKGRGKKA